MPKHFGIKYLSVTFMNFSKQHIVILILGSLFILGTLAAWQWQASTTQQVIQLPAVTNCKLQSQACVAKINNIGTITLDITPKNPTGLDTLMFSAQFKPAINDSHISQVLLEFKGKTMDMGFLQYPLHPKDNQHVFTGKGALSFCTRDVMQWWVNLHFVYNDVHYQLPFEMDTFAAS